MMQNNIRCNYLIQYQIWQNSFEEFMQHKEEGQQKGLKHYQLLEDYFSYFSSTKKLIAPISTIEEYLENALSSDDAQLASLNKYILSLYSDSTFSSPEPFSPKSDLSSQSENHSAILIDSEPENITVPAIQIPEPTNLELSASHLTTSSKISCGFFDWPIMDNTDLVKHVPEKKNSLNSNVDYMSIFLGLPYQNSKTGHLFILAGSDFISMYPTNNKKHSPEEINRRKL